MPRFLDKFMPFMDEAPGASVSSEGWHALKGRGLPSRPFRACHPACPTRSDIMSTVTAPQHDAPTKSRKLVEMSWDPITRIVGSLGIYTKIDFENHQVAECHSTSSIFRGYSVFMKGKDPRDAHFITSRICGICGDNH